MPHPSGKGNPGKKDLMVGVLSLQGDFERHIALLRDLGAATREVRTLEELTDLSGLVIPGGESTTLLKFFESEPWIESLQSFGFRAPIFGTCAGAILLGTRVEHPAQVSLGLIPMTVQRNAYGRQIDSFITDLEDHSLEGDPLPAVFIRAPRIVEVGTEVVILARYQGEAVLVQYGHFLAATFHPELTGDHRVHQLFLDRVQNGVKS
ncbi:MAG TPA: pyridoxal 5'-phosphate synthase glutaminase subunit PdxT [Thermoanaerobaculia bacterium]|nr:pyridoxal 5'-phosphate synthase glutaminase subunit PdxT [Thermoanaerobaculia bacterium]HUM29873.1 pyridoxal 5'-phosphate synthase glutaminase subunit PdxT [Thermoanaerobaculia bacterium]HXK68148.1 pyridoxal 5'-phosphate synthase glutaminase subunit PdxT [Thermoanaerobaculia bacterium]